VSCVKAFSGLKRSTAFASLIVTDLKYSDQHRNKGLSSFTYAVVFDETLVPCVSIKVKPTVFFLHKSSFPLFDVIINLNIILIDCVSKQQVIDVLSLRED
jgi:hypothetical protein